MGNTNKSKYSIDAVGEKYDFSDLTEIINILIVWRMPLGYQADPREPERMPCGRIRRSHFCIDSHDDENLCEELGDLLLQVVMHAQIAAEEGRFTIDYVIQGVSEKMIRRHPHVFGDVSVTDDRESLDLWKQIKEQEKKDRL